MWGGARWSWEADLRSGVQDRLRAPSVLSPPSAASPHCRANSISIPTAHILFHVTALLPRHITSITLISAVPGILVN